MAVKKSVRTSFLPALCRLETSFDSPKDDVKRNPAISPQLDETPIQWRDEDVLAPLADKVLLDLREIVKVIFQLY